MSDAKKEINEKHLIRTPKEFDGLYTLALMFRYKYFTLGFVGLTAIVTLFIVLAMPRWYTATVNAVPPKNSASKMAGGIGSLSSSLKEIGLSKLGGGSSSDDYSFIVILNSRSVKDSLINKYDLAKEYEIPDSDRTLIYKALEGNLEITFEKEGNYTISISSKDKIKAAEMANYAVDLANNINQRMTRSESQINQTYIESRIKATDSVLLSVGNELQKYSKEKMVFSPLDQAKSLSTAYSSIKAELILQETQLSMMKSKYGEKDPIAQTQQKLVNELQNRISDAETKPGFAGNFPLNEATEVGIEFLRLYAEFETFTKVKSFLLPMLEEAKIKEISDTPSLIVLDRATPPDKHSRPKKALIILGAVFGAFVLSVLFIILLDGYRRVKLNYLSYKK